MPAKYKFDISDLQESTSINNEMACSTWFVLYGITNLIFPHYMSNTIQPTMHTY